MLLNEAIRRFVYRCRTALHPPTSDLGRARRRARLSWVGMPVMLLPLGGFGLVGALLVTGCGTDHGCESTLTCADDNDEARAPASADGRGEGSTGGDTSASTGNEAGGSTGASSSTGGTGPASDGNGGNEAIDIAPRSRGPSGGSGASAGTGGISLGGQDAGMSGVAGSGGTTSGEGGVSSNGMPCSTETDCTREMPACDTNLGRCVACLLVDGSGCTPEAPYCVGAGNDVSRCVQCESVDDCDQETPLCNDGTCVACMAEDDCTGFADTPLCRDDGQCVECVTAADCPAGTPVCDETGQCTSCSDDSECTRLPDKPVCDVNGSGACVGCLTSADCGESGTPRCTNNYCTLCLSQDDCTHFIGLPLCYLGTGACVECARDTDCRNPASGRCEAHECSVCTGPADCARFNGLPVCDGSTGACVECVSNDDCGSSTASACVNTQCVACSADADCSHLSGTPVCDTSQGAGRCVQCTGVEDDACQVGSIAYACNSQNRTCGSEAPAHEVGGAGVCDPCLSDANCQAGQLCVKTEFDGVYTGWFCQWVREADSCVNYLPFTESRVVDSLDGTSAAICALSSSTCQAYDQQKKGESCSTADECGVQSLDDAGCDQIVGSCVMACASASSCPGQAACINGLCSP
jgi:hypothetical protein